MSIHIPSGTIISSFGEDNQNGSGISRQEFLDLKRKVDQLIANGGNNNSSSENVPVDGSAILNTINNYDIIKQGSSVIADVNSLKTIPSTVNTLTNRINQVNTELTSNISEKEDKLGAATENLNFSPYFKTVSYDGGTKTLLAPGSDLNSIFKTSQTKAWNPRYFYVDKNTGNDDQNPLASDCGSPTKPFRTIDRAFEQANYGFNDLRIRIIAGGTYETKKRSFSFDLLHLAAYNLEKKEAANMNVIIKFADDSTDNSSTNVPFYSPHVNIQYITFEGGDKLNKKIYFESNSSALSHVTIKNFKDLRFYGGYQTLTACSANTYTFIGCNANLDACICTNTAYQDIGADSNNNDQNYAVFFDACSTGRIQNGITFNKITQKPAVGDAYSGSTVNPAIAIMVNKSILYVQDTNAIKSKDSNGGNYNVVIKNNQGFVYALDEVFTNAKTLITKNGDTKKPYYTNNDYMYDGTQLSTIINKTGISFGNASDITPIPKDKTL